MASSPDPSMPAGALRARALELLLGGDTAGGIAELEAYLVAEPDDAEAWLDLGTAYAAIRHEADAARALARSVELDGDDVDARFAYARVLVALGKLDDAAFQLLRAARLDETDARVLEELGIVFYDKRLYSKAVHWLEKACAAAKTDARAFYALGLAYEACRDMAAAVAAYRAAVRLDPKLVDARLTLADALASLGEHEAAIDELSVLLAVDRTNERAARNREVLRRALADMHARRLLGKTPRELEASALVGHGELARRTEPAEDARPFGPATLRYRGPLLELWATLDPQGAVASLMLLLPSPDRAARTEDDAFRVTVIAQDGRRDAVDYATAASLTFLREALGCPMTHATAIYTRLLAGEGVDWGGAHVAFASAPRPDRPAETRHGILASLST